VLAGIDAAIDAGFDQIKLNTVLMRGRNEDQLQPLIEFAAVRNLVLRFIEMMPVSHQRGSEREQFYVGLGSKKAHRIQPTEV